jgi:hypothetical protein
MSVCGGSEDTRKDTDALDAGRRCTRAGVDVSLRIGEVDGGCCGVGMGDGVFECPNGLFITKRLSELGNQMGYGAYLTDRLS